MGMKEDLELIRDKSPAQYAVDAKVLAMKYLEQAGFDKSKLEPAVIEILDTSIGRLEGRQRRALLERARSFNETVDELIPLLRQRFPDRFDVNRMTEIIGAIYAMGRNIVRNDALV